VAILITTKATTSNGYCKRGGKTHGLLHATPIRTIRTQSNMI